MTTEADLEAKFWKSIKSDRTAMLGLANVDDGVGQPMTFMLDGDAPGPLYTFTAKDNDLVQALDGPSPATLHFTGKSHDLFAAIHGELVADNDRAVIDRLWNPFVAAWFEGGKDDPKLQLLRFEPGKAQIWLNENSAFAGVRILLGRDPKKDYADKVAEVRLNS
jgi:general stress protein 26